MGRAWTSLFLVIGVTLGLPVEASAGGAIELGSKTAVTANFGVLSQDPDVGVETTTVIVGTTVTRTTADARFEYGAGLSVVAILSDAFDATLITPSGQVRVNSDLLGPEENLLAYIGFIAGVTFIDIDLGGGAHKDQVGAFGPKFGLEYYFSSNFAVQLEDAFLIDTDGGISNNLTLGIKLLF